MTADTPTVADFPTTVLAALSPEQKLNFTDQMAKAGYNRTEVEARMAGVTQDQAAATEAAQHLRQMITDPVTRNDAMAKLETKSPGATGAIPPSLQPPADAAEYHLSYGDRARLMNGEDLAALHGEIVTGFQSAGIPTNMGQGILDQMLSSMDAMDGINEAQANSYKAEQRAMLGKAGNVDELIHFAAVALVGFDPEVVQSLKERGAFESATVISALAGAGRAKEFREKRGGK